MPDTEQWVRLINIIQYLARRESSTIRDINDSLFNGQIPVRTLQRDLEKLVLEESIPVEIKEEHQGHEKVFYIEDIYKDKFSKSAMSQEEAIAGKLVIQSLGGV